MHVNDPQIWTLIGVFSAAVLGMMTIMIMLFSRVIRAEIGRLDEKLTGQIGRLDGKLTGQIEALDGKLTGQIEALDWRLNGRIDVLDSKLTARIDALDKEVADIATRFFGKSG